jgi:hypothetical protein
VTKKKRMAPKGVQSLFAPAGFTIETGVDGGPYILLVRTETGSRGVHHPPEGATKDVMQRSVYELAERVVAADGRAHQRRQQMKFEVTQTVKGGMDRADALVKWKTDRRKAREEEEAARG